MKKLVALLLVLIMLPLAAVAANIPTELPIPNPNGDTLRVVILEISKASYADILPVFQEVEKITGVHVEFEPYVETTGKEAWKTRLAAGKDLPDIVWIPDNDVTTYADAGLLIELTDLINNYAPNLYQEFFVDDPRVGATMVSPDGKIYAIANNFTGGNMVDVKGLGIRQDWLDKLGLEVPTNLDEWYNVLKAFKTQDPNGNGEADEIPMYCYMGYPQCDYSYLGTALGLVADASNMHGSDLYFNYVPGADGKLVNQYRTEGFKELIKWLNKCYAEGLIYDYGSATSSMLSTYNSQNKLGSFISWMANVVSYEDTLHSAGYTDAKWVALTPPADANGKANVIYRPNVLLYFGITKDCKNPELAMRWIDFVTGSDQGTDLLSFGIEGLTYTVNANGEKEFTEVITNNPNGWSISSALQAYGGFAKLLLNRKVELYEAMYKGRVLDDAKAYWPLFMDGFPVIIASSEETEELAMIKADLDTYRSEMLTKFVTGQADIDKQWDSFMKTLDGMGQERMDEIRQQQYDRYLEIIGNFAK